ncbi:hypothetical protein EI94DRAFT_1705657 [Lactarius quietus]|nr:hypothetical protein EI94DRAFT_1705657 [Lactarius quietus]
MSTEDFDLNKNVDDSEMSDDSFLDMQPVIPLSTLQIDTVELHKVLKETQLNFQRLNIKYKDLHAKCKVLKSSSKSASIKKGHNTILKPEHPSDVEPLSNQWYSGTSTEKLAISEELYSSLSLHLQDALAHEQWCLSFKKTFLQQDFSNYKNVLAVEEILKLGGSDPAGRVALVFLIKSTNSGCSVTMEKTMIKP